MIKGSQVVMIKWLSEIRRGDGKRGRDGCRYLVIILWVNLSKQVEYIYICIYIYDTHTK